MGDKIVIRPIEKGQVTNRLAFNIDNDSFPTLVNAYNWRGRVKRKRGTTLLGRLIRYFDSNSTSYNTGSSTITLSGGAGNLISGFSLSSNASIKPGTVTIVNTSVAQTYTDNSLGTLTGNLGGTGTINYASGAFTISGGGSNTVRASFSYYPDLPVMGIEDLVLSTSAYPGNIAFDTTYAYNISPSSPYTINAVNFYNNPASTTYNGQAYTQKTTWTSLKWNGQNYQQFWSTNYQGSFWATNGINVPFVSTNVGMQYKAISIVDNITGGPPATADLTITSHGLSVGDWIFVNEVVTTTGINFQTGYVTAVVSANKVTVGFPWATIATNGTGGIAQYLTNNSDSTKDCMRWYNGDPTLGTGQPSQTGVGWVNFCPPLSFASYSIADLPLAQYYLVTARMVLPYKDRILFFGPVVQTSSANSQVYLQDTIIYSQNGTPYYTCSFTGNASLATTTFNPLLVPSNQTATANSFFSDVTGFGGFQTAGIDQPINTVSPNEDALILGFSSQQIRLLYTGNDLVPFNLFLINSEYGSTSTFSSINMDKGVITKGSRGYVITGQTESQRIDIENPDQVFEVSLTSNGNERVTAQRDFISEWIYFTYRANESNATTYVYPTQTFLYNYRDNSWAIFNECYTTYGTIRQQTGNTWANLTDFTWDEWNDPWDAGDNSLLNPIVIGGNQQGFILFRENYKTGEDTSLYISNISNYTITCPDHGLNKNDVIIISGIIGNNNSYIGHVTRVVSANSFLFSTSISGSYIGGGLITRAYVPFIQSKQFPVAWEYARKTRIGAQQYLLTKTYNSQITLYIYLSQDSSTAFNAGPVIPSNNSENNALIYSSVLYTCPESTNLGLTAANTNLQMITYPETGDSPQQQIWHRMNTSLIGDTVQVGFTITLDQMEALNDDGSPQNAFAEVELHSMILDVTPSSMLA